MTLRTKLVATIGVLYLVALVGVGVYAVRSAHERSGLPARPSVPAKAAGCIAWRVNTGPPIYLSRADAQDAASDLDDRYPNLPPATVDCGRTSLATRGIEARQAIPPKTIYERDTIVTLLIASTLVGAVAVGAALIWTKPTAEPARIRAGSDGSDAPTGEVPATESQRSGAHEDAAPPRMDAWRVAESLRQLKALHDEGILTDDEYEAKRRPLTDQL